MSLSFQLFKLRRRARIWWRHNYRTPLCWVLGHQIYYSSNWSGSWQKCTRCPYSKDTIIDYKKDDHE
jgi:hypothetical protein